MTKTVQLDASEWKSLVLNSVAQMHTALSGLDAPDTDALGAINDHINRMHSFVLAWHLSRFPAQQQQAKAEWLEEAVSQGPVALDVERTKKGFSDPDDLGKRKRGRPKGSTNKRNGEAHP